MWPGLIESPQVRVKLVPYHLLLLQRQPWLLTQILLLGQGTEEGLDYHYQLTNWSRKVQKIFSGVLLDQILLHIRLYKTFNAESYLKHFKRTQKLTSFFTSPINLKPFKFRHIVTIFTKLNMWFSNCSSYKFGFSNLQQYLNSKNILNIYGYLCSASIVLK